MTPWAAQLPALMALNLCAKEIARLVNRTPDRVYEVASEMGLSFQSQKRKAILAALTEKPMSVPELAEALNAGREAVRFHVRNLRAAGIVECAFSKPLGATKPTKFWRVVEAGK